MLKRSNNRLKSQNNILTNTRLLAEAVDTNESELEKSTHASNLIEAQIMHKYEVNAINSGQILKKLQDIKFEEEDKIDFQKIQNEDLSLQKYWDMVSKANSKHVLMGEKSCYIEKQKSVA